MILLLLQDNSVTRLSIFYPKVSKVSLIYAFFPCLTASSSAAGGSWRYPLGLLLTHLHRSTHASSRVSSVFQPSSSLARAGLAVRSRTSPALRPTTSYLSWWPTTLLNALIISKTVQPRPEPRFHARTPGFFSRRWLRAARWPLARSTTWM